MIKTTLGIDVSKTFPEGVTMPELMVMVKKKRQKIYTLYGIGVVIFVGILIGLVMFLNSGSKKESKLNPKNTDNLLGNMGKTIKKEKPKVTKIESPLLEFYKKLEENLVKIPQNKADINKNIELYDVFIKTYRKYKDDNFYQKAKKARKRCDKLLASGLYE